MDVKQIMPFFEIRPTSRQNVYRCQKEDIGLEKSKYQEKNKGSKLSIVTFFI